MHTPRLLIGGMILLSACGSDGDGQPGAPGSTGPGSQPSGRGGRNLAPCGTVPSTSKPPGKRAVAINAGAAYVCALFDSGAVRCWGGNAYNYLGYGHQRAIGDDEVPASAGDVPLGGTAVAVAGGHDHSCAILTGGKVRCWGAWAKGQLGYPASVKVTYQSTPESLGDVPLPAPAKQLALGEDYTCVLLETGKIRCWGRGVPAAALDAEGNVALGGVAVSVGGRATNVCAVMDTGAVRCWGVARFGALGYGNLNDVGDDEPPSAAGDIVLGGLAAAVFPGTVHTCALMTGGTVRCWGEGTYGALGYAKSSHVGDDDTPASAGDVPVGGLVIALDTSNRHTCAVLESGSLRCWGSSHGRLGYGSDMSVGDDETPASWGDVPIGGKAVGVATTTEDTCVLFDTGGVRCQGPKGAILGRGDGTAVGGPNDIALACAGDIQF
jgi:alpha-tubulin suppressor-like RCC1 family protein